MAWATASGLTEPLGGLVGLTLVSFVIPQAFLGVFSALVAGMMVFLTLAELRPGAWRYQTDKHQTVYGMVVVALSLVLRRLRRIEDPLQGSGLLAGRDQGLRDRSRDVGPIHLQASAPELPSPVRIPAALVRGSGLRPASRAFLDWG